jgi:pseudouridine-5'-phosphate glycosidase
MPHVPKKQSDAFSYSAEVKRAQAMHLPLVALESTVITHGLPKPQNIQLAQDMEREVRNQGAVPATIAVLEGYIKIGLSLADLEKLAAASDPVKVSRRDFAPAIANGDSGGTTVAGTMFAAHAAQIKVFATGGIGGVHRGVRFDVSTDLQALADTPMIVVCAGAKSILDIPATLEYLETMSVPVVGYKTDDFPAFYSKSSGRGVSTRVDEVKDLVALAQYHWELGFNSGLLVVQPIPDRDALKPEYIDPIIERVTNEVAEQEIHGQDVTPFELKRITELTDGQSMRANLSLLLNNARLAAQIAKQLTLADKMSGAVLT